MRVGLLYMMYGAPHVDLPQMYHSVLDQIELADALGYDAVWLAEHHLARDDTFCGRLPAPLAFLSAAAMRTKRVRLGTAVAVLPLHNPLFVAEEAAVVDLLSRGRLNLGVGQGVATDLQLFGVPSSDKAERFREAVEVLLAAWQPRPFVFEGRFYTYRQVALCPTPLQLARDLLWIAARDEATLRWAARQRLRLLIGQAERLTRQAVYAQQYRDELARTGARDVPDIAGTRLCYVAETTAEAKRDIEDAAYIYYERFRRGPYYQAMLRAGDIVDDGHLTFEQILANIEYIVGDPDDVARGLQQVIDSLGLTYLNCMIHLAGLDQPKVVRCLHLFAREVMPRLRPARGAQTVF